MGANPITQVQYGWPNNFYVEFQQIKIIAGEPMWWVIATSDVYYVHYE